MPAPREGPAPRYVDRPELSETFADSVHRVLFDGSTARIEFVVTRWDEVGTSPLRKATLIPTCRLVLPAAGLLELINKIEGMRDALAAQGLIAPTLPGH
jgi:hypothetical protein